MPDFGDLVVLPLIVCQVVSLLEVNVVDTSTAVLLLDIPLELLPLWVVLVVFLQLLHCLRNESLALSTTHRLSHVDTGKDIAQSPTGGTGAVDTGLELLRNSLSQELVASSVLHPSHAFSCGAR